MKSKLAIKRIKRLILLAFLFFLIFSIISRKDCIAKAFNNFSTNNKLYCLNRGFSFTKYDTGYGTIGTFTVKGNSVMPNPSNLGNVDLNFLGEKSNHFRLAYILSKIPEYPPKPSIGDSPIQVAIWLITNPHNYLSSSTSQDSIDKGKKIKDESDAYANFVNGTIQDLKINYDGTNPSTYNNGYVGPFQLFFTQSTTNNGSRYGNIIEISVSGKIVPVYNSNFQQYNSVGKIRNGDKIYIKRTDIQSLGTSLELTVKQETTIDATYNIYHSDTNGHGLLGTIYRNQIYIIPHEENGTIKIFCTYCMGEHSINNGYCITCGAKINNSPGQQGCIHTPANNTSNSQVKYYTNIGNCGLEISVQGGTYQGQFYDISGGAAIIQGNLGSFSSNYAIGSTTLDKRQNLLELNGNAVKHYKDKTLPFSLIPSLGLQLIKADKLTGNNISGAVCTVTAKQGTVNLPITGLNNHGEVTIPANISISPKNSSNITVTITEKQPPQSPRYMGISNSIVITYKLNGNQWQMVSVGGNWQGGQNGDYTIGDDKININGTTIKIYNYPIPAITLDLQKKDNLGTQGLKATFTVQAIQGNTKPFFESQYTTPLSEPIKIQPTTKEKVVVTIKEITPPAKHQGISHTIQITYKYVVHGTTAVWEIDSITDGSVTWAGSNGNYSNGTYGIDNDRFDLTISGNTFTIVVNNYYIPNLYIGLTKKNTADMQIAGATFQITAIQDNTSLPIHDYLYDQPYENGEVEIPFTGNIVKIFPQSISDIKVTIKEIVVPKWHIEIETPIQLTFRYTLIEAADGTKYAKWEMVNIPTNGGKPEKPWVIGENNTYTFGKDKIGILEADPWPEFSQIYITMYDRPKTDFQFLKIDELTNLGIPGIKFNVKIRNCAGGPSNITSNFTTEGTTLITDEKGSITLNDLEFLLKETTDNEVAYSGVTYRDDYKIMIITLTELEQKNTIPQTSNLPNYRLLKGPIEIYVRYLVNKNTGEPSLITWFSYNGNIYSNNGEYDGVQLAITTSNIMRLIAKDQPIIHLGGMVWLDEQQGEKGKAADNAITNSAQAPNGIIDKTEKGIGGIPIYLLKTENNGRTYQRVQTNTYGETLMTETSTGNGIATYINPNSDQGSEKRVLDLGEYFFPSLPKLANGYYVIFYSYDGVNYISTIDGTDQDANESSVELTRAVETIEKDIRTYFNNRLLTIEDTTTINSFGELDEEQGTVSKIIYANTPKQLEYDTYVDGIYEYYAGQIENNKSILKTTTDYNAKTHTNGVKAKEEFKIYSKTKQNYNITELNIDLGLQKRELDLSLGDKLIKAEVSINGKTTIYNYSSEYEDPIIEIDGTTVGIGETAGNEMSYTVNNQHHLKLYKSDYEYQNGDEDELEVYVTYEIQLNNKSIINLYQHGLKAQVNKVADYYDANYTFDSAWYGSPDSTEGIALVANQLGQKNIEGRNYKSMILSNKRTNQPLATVGENERQSIYIRFRVNGLGQDINVGEYNNIAEIVSYSTTVGLVDKNSKPNSSLEGESNSILQLKYEDDTDMARGLMIELQENQPRTRTISGNVWEDIRNQTGSDGKYKYGDGIRTNGESGVTGIEVQLIEIRGTEEILKDSVTTQNGNYTFSSFIPGDYVVRFIYNGETYHGQNYKSSIVNNTHYTNELNNENNWFYNKLYKIDGSTIENDGRGSNTSKAIDRAIRRLELMEKFVQITKDNYPKNTNGDLGMEAKTPKIYVSVDTDDFSDTDGTTEVQNGSNPIDITVKCVSLGIEKRPATKITLEEHIKRTSLIANDGVAFLQAEIIDEALFNNNNEMYGEQEILGLKDGLKAGRTLRDNFEGIWEVQTDVAEIVQGSTVETEIIYRVKNEGDIDYISKKLNDAYNSKTIDDYKNEIRKYMSSNATAMEAIGITYFRGIINKSVANVGIKVESIKDYVDYLQYESGDFTKNEGGEFNILDSNGNGAKQEIEQTVTSGETNILKPGEEHKFKALLKRAGLTPSGKLDFENYISQIMSYTSPVGRQDEEAVPGDLEDKFIYSYDTNVTLEANEHDEYKSEKIIIQQTTGEDKETPVIMIISITAGIAVIGLGIVLIKKFIIK